MVLAAEGDYELKRWWRPQGHEVEYSFVKRNKIPMGPQLGVPGNSNGPRSSMGPANSNGGSYDTE